MPPNNINIFRRFLFMNQNADNINGRNRPGRNRKFQKYFTFQNYSFVSLFFYLLIFTHRFKQNVYQYKQYLESNFDPLNMNENFPFLMKNKNFINVFNEDNEEEQTRNIILEILKHQDQKHYVNDQPEGGVKSLFYDINFFAPKKLQNKDNEDLNIPNNFSSAHEHYRLQSLWKTFSDILAHHYLKRKSWSLKHLKKISQILIDAPQEISINTLSDNIVEKDMANILKPIHVNKLSYFNKLAARVSEFFFYHTSRYYNLALASIKYNFQLDSLTIMFYSLIIDQSFFTIFKMFHTDYWISMNAACCCLILFAKIIQKIVFGNLRSAEVIHLKEKIGNFIFNKMIFMFGLLNVDNLADFTLWTSWFAITCFLHSTALLLKARIDYLSLSPRIGAMVKIKLGLLLTFLLFWSNALTAAVFFSYFHFNTLAAPVYLFLLYECFMLQLHAHHILFSVLIHTFDSYTQGGWEHKSQITYYGDLIFGVSILLIDLLYHLHMLLWGSIILSMASLFICMELRWLFGELKTKIIKHQNYLRIMKQMDKRYPMATAEDLKKYNNNCSICWDPLKRARKLPCDHLFHDTCLRSWLEHDSSCPICRRSLNPQPPARPPTSNVVPVEPLLPIEQHQTESLSLPTPVNVPHVRRLPNPVPPPTNTIRRQTPYPISETLSNLLQTTPTPIGMQDDNVYANTIGRGGSVVNRIVNRLSMWNQQIIFHLIDLLFNASAALTVSSQQDGTDPTTNPTNNARGHTTTTTENILTIPIVNNNGVTVTRRVSRVNRLFHFDASTFASWLPTFSLQISHLQFQEFPMMAGTPNNNNGINNNNQSTTTNTNSTLQSTPLANQNTLTGGPADNTNLQVGDSTPINNSIIDDMVRQVSHIFPHIPNSVIRSDLSLTWSVDRTIENILEGPIGLAYLHLDDVVEDEANNNNITNSGINSTPTYFPTATYPVTSSSTIQNHRTSNGGGTFTGTFTADFRIGSGSGFLSRYPNFLTSANNDTSSGSSISSNSSQESEHLPPTASSNINLLNEIARNSTQPTHPINNANTHNGVGEIKVNRNLLDHYFQRLSSSHNHESGHNNSNTLQPSTSQQTTTSSGMAENYESLGDGKSISTDFPNDFDQNLPQKTLFKSYRSEFAELARERESLLTKRKREMIMNARKHIISGDTTPESYSQPSSSTSYDKNTPGTKTKIE